MPLIFSGGGDRYCNVPKEFPENSGAPQPLLDVDNERKKLLGSDNLCLLLFIVLLKEWKPNLDVQSAACCRLGPPC